MATSSSPTFDAQAILDRARLISGLVLFAYVLSHLINHMVGIFSIHKLEAGREIFVAFWRTDLATVALYGALAVHMMIAWRSVFLRRHLKTLKGAELGQILLGSIIPFLLIYHVTGTRIAHAFFDVEDTYSYVLLAHWVYIPWVGAVQAAALVTAWAHACIGLNFWLSSKAFYSQWRPYLFVAAVMVPTISLLGWIDAGLFVLTLSETDRSWVREALVTSNALQPGLAAEIIAIRDRLYLAYAALVASVLVARVIKHRLEKRAGLISITYPNGDVVQILKGTTVLEASRMAGIPHASVCGGRGRCSTCRTRIDQGFETIPTATDDEQKVLNRVSAPPQVRLACQLKPTQDIQVTPLLAPSTRTAPETHRGAASGDEREIAVLFADIRSFTRLTETKLPYDTVFLLNRYFAEMGQAVTEGGGRLDKFIGDGVMALFGIDEGPKVGARRAIETMRLMAEHLERLNASLSHDLDSPLRIGISVHAGPCIVGEMGYGRATGLTAIGDTVNTASRLESMTKELAVQCVISEEAASYAGMPLEAFPRSSIDIRGRKQPLSIIAVQDGRTLPKPS